MVGFSLVWLCVGSLFSSCGWLQPVTPTAIASGSPEAECSPLAPEQLLKDYEHFQALSLEDLRRELEHAEQRFARHPSPEQRFRLVLLFSVAHPALTDRPRALAMLHDYLAASHPQPCQRVARLVAALLTDPAQATATQYLQEQLQEVQAEQDRLVGRAQTLQSQLQEALTEKERLTTHATQCIHQVQELLAAQQQLMQLNAQLHKQLEQERATTQTLRKQIEELKNIEKRLLEQRQEKSGT
jgi:hypothetical protein